MMYEFRWRLPTSPTCEVLFRLHTRRGWFGPKTLDLAGAGPAPEPPTPQDAPSAAAPPLRPGPAAHRLYRRGRFEGADCSFSVNGRAAELRIVRDPRTGRWQPVLTFEGRPVPEVTGAEPPLSIAPPPVLMVTVGLTYLTMLMALVMLPSIATILDALFGQGRAFEIPGYRPAHHIVPWIIPTLATAAALVGVCGMRRWSLLVLWAVIAGELAILAFGAFQRIPLSPAALALQTVVAAVASRYAPRMQ